LTQTYPPKEFWEVETVSIAATAGNVGNYISPGAGYRFIPLYGIVTLVCDGTAANRFVHCEPEETGGSQIGPHIISKVAITANQTKVVSFSREPMELMGDAQGYDLSGDITVLKLPEVIQGTDRFYIHINAGVAGDSWTAVFRCYKIRS